MPRQRGEKAGYDGRVDDAGLDNPFHSALATLHAGIAMRSGDVVRYPPTFAPFIGVPAPGLRVDDDLDALVPKGDTVLWLGHAPDVGGGWAVEAFRPLAQMVCDAPIAVVDGPDAILLGDAHRDDVLALVALVYPHYFRQRTTELGRYFGIYLEGRLAAMAGERLGTDGARELSAICTHPDFTGRGLASRLTGLLANDILAGGRLPFLHVSHENPRAFALYGHLGFRHRRDIPFQAMRRR